MSLIKPNYADFLSEIKSQIKSSQAKAALSVNASLISMYWNIGEMIAVNQAENSWGNGIIEQLSRDLKSEFPDTSGFSRANLFFIRRFYLFYTDEKVQQAVRLLEDTEKSVQQLVALNEKNPDILKLLIQIPWGHHVLILTKIKEIDAAYFYLNQTIENNWSRAVLTLHIEQNLFSRQGKAVSNFQDTLPESQARLAQRMLKDPYNFDFLTLEPKVQELEIEKKLTEQITKFLLELGRGFAFMGRQYKIEIGSKEYLIDLLFYHIRLRCFVVIELKAVEFEPEFAGKLNFYLSAVDDLLKNESDNPTIGILLCKSRDKFEVEYTLRDINKPIGVSEFTYIEKLPADLQKEIPTVEEFEKGLTEEFE
jgi:predicted nuclease of restriction endonuclease-like (RecB) superfamily